MSSQPSPHELRITRKIAASAEEIFDAFTDPESLAEWMVPKPQMRTRARVELRVGGHFQIDMHEGETHYPHQGEYLRLERPRLLEFSWISQATLGQRSVVTVELRVLSARETELTLTQRLLPSAQALSEHHAGWSAALEQLGLRFEG